MIHSVQMSKLKQNSSHTLDQGWSACICVCDLTCCMCSSIHNEVLQNACSLHILLDSPTTCINNIAIAKRFQGKALPGLVVRMRSANTTLFSLTPSFSLLLSHSCTCTLSVQSTGGIRLLDQPHCACVLLGVGASLFPSILLTNSNLIIFFLGSKVIVLDYFCNTESRIVLFKKLTWKLPISQIQQAESARAIMQLL